MSHSFIMARTCCGRIHAFSIVFKIYWFIGRCCLVSLIIAFFVLEIARIAFFTIGVVDHSVG